MSILMFASPVKEHRWLVPREGCDKVKKARSARERRGFNVENVPRNEADKYMGSVTIVNRTFEQVNVNYKRLNVNRKTEVKTHVGGGSSPNRRRAGMVSQVTHATSNEGHHGDLERKFNTPSKKARPHLYRFTREHVSRAYADR